MLRRQYLELCSINMRQIKCKQELDGSVKNFLTKWSAGNIVVKFLKIINFLLTPICVW